MGFAAGFQVGAQAVERGLRMREENEQRERIKAAMGLTAQEVEQRQATPDELGRARAETQAMAAQDAEVFGLTPQEQVSYAPQMPVEGQRIGLNRYQVGQQSFDRMPTQNEIEDVRYGAAANVLAERDPVAAQRMRRELRIAKQQDELYPLQKQQLEGALAGQVQERDLKSIQLKGLTRTETELQNASNFATFAAERPDATAAELKEAAFKQFKFTPEQWQKTVTTRLGIENAEMASFKNNVKKKLQGKNLTQLGSLYNSDPDFDDKTDLAIVPGKGGAVTLNFIDKTTKAITGTQTFKNEALATEYLNKQATEPETLGSWMMSLRKTEAAIEASGASAAKDRAIGGLYAAGGKDNSIESLVKEAKKLVTDGVYKDLPTAIEGLKRGSVKAEFNPKEYASAVNSFVQAGMSLPAAEIKADQLYGRGPAAGNEDAALQAANKKKGIGTATAPIEVRPGESRMTVPGAAVRGPLEDFLRESRRGMFGGVEYFYTDPLTKKRYTTEQYNQLQNQ